MLLVFVILGYNFAFSHCRISAFIYFFVHKFRAVLGQFYDVCIFNHLFCVCCVLYVEFCAFNTGSESEARKEGARSLFRENSVHSSAFFLGTVLFG